MIERILPQKETEYSMPTEIVFGRGALMSITKEQLIFRAKMIVLVTGDHFKRSEEFSNLKAKLGEKGRDLFVYEDSVKTSDFDMVNGLTRFLWENQPDVVVTIGGGTVIDTAKSAAILAKNEGTVEDYLVGKKKITSGSINLIAIPTTAGTGSEVTPWAVVWDYKNNKKYSLSSLLMFPSLAIVDPSLTDELPPKITAETGIDALTQAIEAYWSKFHNPASDKYALEAVSLATEYLPCAVNSPDSKSRDMMTRASLFSGLAFSNTKTTICHSVSYPITIHWGIAHGQAVSITLPKMIEYSLSSLGKERSDALLLAIGAKTIKEAPKKIKSLMESIGLATRLSELGMTENDINTIVSEGYNPDRMNNAPRIPTHSELKELLKSIL